MLITKGGFTQPTIPFSQSPKAITGKYMMAASDLCVLYNGNRSDNKFDSIYLPTPANANQTLAYEIARSYTAGNMGPVAYAVYSPTGKINNATGPVLSLQPGAIQKFYSDGRNWFTTKPAPKVLIPQPGIFFVVNQANNADFVELPKTTSSQQGQTFKIKTYKLITITIAESGIQADVLNPLNGRVINPSRGAYCEYILNGSKWILIAAEVF